MSHVHRWAALAVLLAAARVLAADPPVSGGKEGAQTNVILVHGAFADASSWRKVIPLLEAKNLHVVAVQLPETSIEDDVAATKRILSVQKGPVVLVGHSYGGMVITAAADDPNVRALVYVTALMPEQGEGAGDLIARFPPTAGGKHIVPLAGDFLWLDPSAYHEMFCPDVPAADARVMVAVQKPINKSAFAAKLTAVARWHDLPTWYVITSKDKMLSPELQKFLAQRAKAKTTTVAASHVPFLSKPQEVAKVIVEAARFKAKPQP
jgi:pimeloyl-ACP methyl ester carboxylesterase